MRIQREHELGKEEARKRVADIADDLCREYSLNSSWQGDQLKIGGSGVDGCLVVAENSVDVEVKLGFALSMMSSTVRTYIEDALESHLR